MRVVFIGSVEFSKKVLEKLFVMGADIVGVVTTRNPGVNSDHVDLAELCRERNVDVRKTNNINEAENVLWIKEKRPDIVFCFGFSQMLGKEILSVAPMGVVGYHPAELPMNRGRHPLIWALVLELRRTASTFFFMDQGADSGDVLDQKKIKIDRADNARTLYEKMVSAATEQIGDIVPKLEKGKYKRVPQDPDNVNYWRRRMSSDGKIDPRMTARAIYNLVRALSSPYPGAHVVHDGKEIKVWEVEEKKCSKMNIEPGKIMGVRGRHLTVKCAEGAIVLKKHEFKSLPKKGEYII